ncbi:hypothetical protein A9975_24485 [Cupriavidus sp. UME77]|nr:hypothetical protein [Cupriavidus sp. UME77]
MSGVTTRLSVHPQQARPHFAFELSWRHPAAWRPAIEDQHLAVDRGTHRHGHGMHVALPFPARQAKAERSEIVRRGFQRGGVRLPLRGVAGA